MSCSRCVIYIVYAYIILPDQWLKNGLYCTKIHHISNMHLSSSYEEPYYKSFDQIVASAGFVSYVSPLIAKGLPLSNFVCCVGILACMFLSSHRQFCKWVYAIIKKFTLLLGKSLSAVMDKSLVLQILQIIYQSGINVKTEHYPFNFYKCSHTNV